MSAGDTVSLLAELVVGLNTAVQSIMFKNKTTLHAKRQLKIRKFYPQFKSTCSANL